MNGLADVKNYNMKDKLDNRFDGYQKKWGINYLLKRKYYYIKQTFVDFILKFGEIILYIFLIIFFKNKDISLSMFLVLISYFEKSRSSTKEIMSYNMNIVEESISMQRIKEIITFKNKNILINNLVEKDDIIGMLEFKNVSFKYDTDLILKNVSFQVNPQEITSIVGATGTGKTTIFNLLSRAYKAHNGSIFIDNIDIFEYSKNVYSSNVTIVNQHPFLFNMSISRNLALVDSNKEHQINACKRVGIHDFIMSLKGKYSTVLNSNSTNISGGQKELLSIARALLTSSEIILLDEVTSNLDSKTTNHIIKLLKDLKQDHTILTITHDKDLMVNSDKIIVLKDGVVKGIGTHEELIKTNKVYIDLYNSNTNS